MIKKYMISKINLATYLEKDLQFAYGSTRGKGCSS